MNEMAQIDPRLTKEIATILDEMKGTVDVFSNVDIDHVDLYANKDGGSIAKFFQIVSSDDSTKITRKNDEGDIVEDNFVVIADYPSNIVPKAPNNLRGDLAKTEEVLPQLISSLSDFSSGVNNLDEKAVDRKIWLTRVRQYMNVMNEVFGFNTPKQLEVFIAAWCTKDSTTRLTGIPGTGKTTLIECSAMLFSNSYGFNESGAPLGQVWDSDKLRNREVREAWDSTRFDEDSYQYPFTFLTNTIVTGQTLDSVHEATKGMVIRRPEYGVGGSLDHKEFNTIADALEKNQKLLLVNGGGVPIRAEKDANSEDTTWTQYTGRKIKPADGEEYDEVNYYYAVPIKNLDAKSKECSIAYNQVSKDSDGRPNAGASTSAETLSNAMWFYEYGDLLNTMLADASKLSARDFVGKWFYDQRRNMKDGIRSIDNEMRREIGTAKIDKDKRAEQVLYGVEIQSKDITGGSQYVFEPYPRPIVTQPVKFFNEINRSQPGVEDAILGLIAEKEVEYRGQVFNSPSFVNWMDNNPHVGGNDLAFTDRIDIELLFPSALLDQRYKVLKAKNTRSKSNTKPRDRVLDSILEGKITPIRFNQLKEGVWKSVDKVGYSAPGYNALMDIAIVSMLFSQRFGVHPAESTVSAEGYPRTGFTHTRQSGTYADSIKPLTASGWFVDASVSETTSYRTNIGQSADSLEMGHGVFTLLNRVLAFRFTNSLAKFARSLAWLRGNEYVTRREVMDMLPYVVGHRIGRARGENNKVVFGLDDDAAGNFQSGQEFVREAIVEGYINRNIDSFMSTTGKAGGGNGKQSRWIEWDSMIAQARKDLASSPTYADYEKKMWGMAKLGAIGDGSASVISTATGDPYPYLIYRLILMEELTATGDTSMHPFKVVETRIESGREVKDVRLKDYQSRVNHYQKEVMKYLTTKQNYSANDIGIIRKKISIERWLITDDKSALLTQIDSLLDGMTGSEIPDSFPKPGPSSELVKYWGLYSACTDNLPVSYPMGLDLSSILGFPVDQFKRTYTWYGGSATGRTKFYLYRGQESLLTDTYPGIKGRSGPVADVATGATYPIASKLNAQQSATIQASIESAEDAQTFKNKLNNFLADFNNGVDFSLVDGTGANVQDVINGTGEGLSLEDMQSKINSFVDKVQQSTKPMDETNAKNQLHMCIETTHRISEYGEQAMPEGEDRLRLWISTKGSVGGAGNTRKVATINLCLSSAFVKLVDSKLEVVSTTDSEPFGVDTASDIAIGDIANTYRDGTIFTFFDAGNITTQDVQKYSRMLQSHNIG